MCKKDYLKSGTIVIQVFFFPEKRNHQKINPQARHHCNIQAVPHSRIVEKPVSNHTFQYYHNNTGTSHHMAGGLNFFKFKKHKRAKSSGNGYKVCPYIKGAVVKVYLSKSDEK